MKPIAEDRLRNTRAWAAARLGQLSGAEVIVGAIDELLTRRAAQPSAEPRERDIESFVAGVRWARMAMEAGNHLNETLVDEDAAYFADSGGNIRCRASSRHAPTKTEQCDHQWIGGPEWEALHCAKCPATKRVEGRREGKSPLTADNLDAFIAGEQRPDETKTPLTYDQFWQRVRETDWNPSAAELRALLMAAESETVQGVARE